MHECPNSARTSLVCQTHRRNRVKKTLHTEPKTDQQRFQDLSCSNLFQALSHSTASHKTSVKYMVTGLLLHLQGTPESPKIDLKVFSEPWCNKCPKLRPNCTAYHKTLVKYMVFVAFFRSPDHLKSIKNIVPRPI